MLFSQQLVQSAPGDEFWDSAFGTNGFSGYGVGAIALFGNGVVFGGAFNSIGGITATNIARWDGTNWSTFGDGLGISLNNGPRALLECQGSLFAAGIFTNAGPVDARNIARWDGTNWHALGSGIDRIASALATDGSNIYVGGDLRSAGGIPVLNIAKWDGIEWQALGPGVAGPVFAIAVDSNSVYVGGRFTSAGSVAVTNIARWDGTNWHALGNGLRRINGFTPENGTVWSLVYHRGYLYAGGGFWLAGNVQAVNIARWDGASWENIGGAANSVDAFVPNGADLYVGGSFINIGGVSARVIARWDGSNWSALGSGMWGGGILALASTGTELFAGGDFTGAGDKTSTRIALWHIPHSLSIQRTGNDLGLSWPSTGTNFLLEATSHLGAPNWQGVSGTPDIVNDQCVVTIPLGPGNQFYRLRPT